MYALRTAYTPPIYAPQLRTDFCTHFELRTNCVQLRNAHFTRVSQLRTNCVRIHHRHRKYAVRTSPHLFICGKRVHVRASRLKPRIGNLHGRAGPPWNWPDEADDLEACSGARS
jgi:hypothetical protein